IDDRIEVSGDGTMAKVLGAGVLVEQKSSDYFLNASSPRAQALLLNSRQLSRLPGNRSAASTNVGPASAAFVRDILRHTRGEKAEALRALPSGISDVRLFRVGVANGLNNIKLSAVSSSGSTQILQRVRQ